MNLFRDPFYLLAAAAGLAACAGLSWWAARRRERFAAAFADPETLFRLFDPAALTVRARANALRAAALCLLLTALAGPQWGVELVQSRAKGTQVVIALDTSTSMLAEDLKPNRLARAKSAMAQLIDGLVGSRVGIIAFAGDAFLQCPLTHDADAAKSILRRLLPGMIRRPGTEVGKAIEVASEMLSKFEGHKALVLLTDGEDHGKGAVEAAQAAAEAGIRIFVIGTGTPEGEPIPVKNPDDKVVGYKKDANGKTVISRLGEASLIRIAAASKGSYFRATATEEEIEEILRQIDGLEKGEIQGGSANRYINRYRFPLLLSFLSLLLALAWPELPKKRPPPAAPKGRRKEIPSVTAAFLLLLFGSSGALALPAEVGVWRGNSDYRDGNYGKALQHYKNSGTEKNKALFNAGAALYKMGELDASAGAYAELVGKIDPNPEAPALPAAAGKGARAIAPKAYYNLGNALFKMNKFDEAAAAYKRCLILDPKDEDCRHNLVLSLRPRKNQQDQKQDKQQKKEDKKEEEKKKDEAKKQPPQKDRPREQEFSKEDAERLLKAVREKERAAQKRQPMDQESAKNDPTPVREDW